MKATLRWNFQGPVPYLKGIDLMNAAVERVSAAGSPSELLMFEHQPTITAGIRSCHGSLLITREDLVRKGVEYHAADRGGDLTWHGPGQLVGYPVVDIRRTGHTVPEFVCAVENALVRWLLLRGVCCSLDKSRPGVWLDTWSKIASIGLGIRNGVTCHGFALNLCGPLSGSDLIVPCGLAGVRLAALDEVSKHVVEPRDAAKSVAKEIGAELRMAPVFNGG